MARYRQIIRTLLLPVIDVWRRWPKLTVFAVVILMIIYIPYVPFHPLCDQFYWKNHFATDPLPEGFSRTCRVNDVKILGPMRQEYVDRLTRNFDATGIIHLRLGNRVFVRFWDWIEDPSGYVGRSNSAAFRLLAIPESSPLWNKMPEEIRSMVRGLKGPLYAADHCDLARALSIENWGRPPASGTAQSPVP